MRRVIVVGVLLLAGVLLWRMLPPGLNFGGSPIRGPEAGPGLPATGADPASVLRIEINEAAPEAEADYRKIRRRYGKDPTARAWVAECVAQSTAREQDQRQFAESWEYACWRSWGRQQQALQP